MFKNGLNPNVSAKASAFIGVGGGGGGWGSDKDFIKSMLHKKKNANFELIKSFRAKFKWWSVLSLLKMSVQ